MSKLILTTELAGIVSIAFAGCQTTTTTTTNTGSNTGEVNSNTDQAKSHTPMAMNGGSMNQNGMMTGSNHDMATSNHSGMASSPNAASAPFDLQFLDTMTHHHQGALDMAKTAVEKTRNQELKAFAQKIINDQEKEIAQMKEWREK